MVTQFCVGQDGKRMVLIPAGEFTMGTSEEDRGTLSARCHAPPVAFDDEIPAHPAFLDAFYIDETPVTYAEYGKFLEANPGYTAPPGWLSTRGSFRASHADCPVVNVSWDDANAYARWAGKQLPTEAQWEKAARGGDGRVYPWGDEFDPSRCNTWEAAIFDLTPVRHFAPRGNSPYGVMDMVGNVWEWCADWYAHAYYQVSPAENPRGPQNGIFRVLRGGAWNGNREEMRAANRHYFYPGYRDVVVGFRCVTQNGI